MKKCKIVVLISGFGSNLQAIINQTKSGRLPVEIKAVISNKADAYGLARAKKAKIPTEVFSLKDFREKGGYGDSPGGREKARRAYCTKLSQIVKKYSPDLVVLAGWMLVLTNEFLKEFPNRVINLHPALCPAFPGVEGIKQAYDYGAKVTGVTVHFVIDEGVDTGPIIIQRPVIIKEGESLESLEKRIHEREHQILPEAIRLFTLGKLKIEGRKVEHINS